MAPSQNLAFVFEKVPEGLPKPGQDLVTKDVGIDLSEPPTKDEVVLEILYASYDPYLRGMMRSEMAKSYRPPLAIGSTVMNNCVARVIASASADFKEGDMVAAGFPIQQYVRIEGADLTKRLKGTGAQRIPKDPGLDVQHYLGALGMPGLTAYSSLYDIGKPKKGETIFISSAAGAVGQLVGQLAKHEGLRVIGSVGSDDKLKYLTEEIGFDGGFNYKKEKTPDALSRLAPDGVDIYYDNVGGEQLEAALEAMNLHGRIVACGMISQYNVTGDDRYPLRNLTHVVRKRLDFKGFIVSDDFMGPKYLEEHQKNITKWLKDGSFKAKNHETVGMENAAEGFVGMLKGENFGKAVLKIKV